MAEVGKRRTAVTIGTFDGVHLGHRALLERTGEIAWERGLESVALTFPWPPQNYLGRPKPLLLPPEVKIELLRDSVDRVVVLEFPEVQPLMPREFVVRTLVERLNAAVVVAGEAFRFGRDRRGDVSLLQALGRELGFEIEIVESILVDGRRVSSTAIREALHVGDVERAKRLLGRAPLIVGGVVPGAGEGRRLGYPTANLAVHPELLIPAHGVYAAWCVYRGEKRPGALYIGRRPTYDGTSVSVEAHILGADDVPPRYGEQLEAQMLSYLRGDRRFISVEALRGQIEADIEAVQAYFAHRARTS